MKNMKKIIALSLSLLLVVGLTACGGSSASSSAAGGAGKVAKISLASGGTSGTYYGFSGVIAQTLNASLKDVLNIKVESTGASKANVQLVDAGESQIAILQNDVMTYAYQATDMFAGSKPVTSFSAIGSCYPETVQIIANKKINSIEELRGKKVSVGDAGSGTEFNAKQILEIYGMDIDKDIAKNNQSFGDSSDAIKNGTIDAAFVTAGHPTVAITELASSYDFNILSVDDAHASALIAKYPFYSKVAVPGGTYGPVPNDVNTVAVMATFIASNDLDENVVYQFTKALFEQKGDFQHAKAAELDPKTGVSGIGIPFHPGAEKYYKEIGVLK